MRGQEGVGGERRGDGEDRRRWREMRGKEMEIQELNKW